MKRFCGSLYDESNDFAGDHSLICEQHNISEDQALDVFYHSATGASFADDETGLYGQSPLFMFGLYEQELAEKSNADQAL